MKFLQYVVCFAILMVSGTLYQNSYTIIASASLPVCPVNNLALHLKPF
uniref:Uncharacterized protein n=1 Tax=Anguilla anguilla TaxID=7936 RepID=A0A0E9WJW3_ANGAN